jgi:Flp pilus assembly protein TadD
LAEARLAFETALRLGTRFSRAHQQLGFALALLGQLADAERALEKALEVDPADTETRDALVELREIIKSRQRSN